MTLQEINECERIACVIEVYRNTHHFIHSVCWMDEWCLGYFCALRDIGIINVEQWGFLCSAFTQEIER